VHAGHVDDLGADLEPAPRQPAGVLGPFSSIPMMRSATAELMWISPFAIARMLPSEPT
jgi:hypothetical protein